MVPNSGIVCVDGVCIDVDCGTDDARPGATTKGTPLNLTFDPVSLIAEQLPFVGVNDATVVVIDGVVSLFAADVMLVDLLSSVATIAAVVSLCSTGSVLMFCAASFE